MKNKTILFIILTLSLSCKIWGQESSLRFDKLLIKTNLLADVGTIANIGAEICITDKYTFNLPLYYSPYTVKQSFKLKVLIIQPEVKYWLKSKPFEGHYLGANINTGWYNIATNNKTRYQDNKMLIGGGLTYGYYLPLSNSNFIIGGSIGAGYCHFSYDKFRNSGNKEFLEKGTFNYWGITQLDITLAYKINLK